MLGRAAYPLTAVARLPGHRPFQATITTGDRHCTVKTHQLNIANGIFHAGRPITGDVSADRTRGSATGSRCFCRYHIW